MKQKRTYSLTAKERKALRAAQDKKKNGRSAESAGGGSSTREAAESEMVAAQKNSRKTNMTVIAVVGVAIALILAAILVPSIMYVVNPYSFNGNDKVMARFSLSNGMTLEYIIEEDKYDTAATNFIFLAKNGFFDNTVFFDAQNGWLRFGGYESQPTTNYSSSDFNRTHHRKDNKAYCDSFKALANDKFDKTTYKFGYRLRADSNGTDAKYLEEEGVLTYLYSDTATEFQFSYQPQATNQIVSMESNGTQKTYDLNPTMVGRALNDKTLQNIKAIAATAQLNTGMTTGYMWRPPTPNIMINSVKIYNLDGKKWKKFDFITYMRENDSSGQRRLSQWIGTV